MAGKGSKPRPYSVNQSQFANNWDSIFNKTKNTDTDSNKDWYLIAINPWYKIFFNPKTNSHKKVNIDRNTDK